MENMDILAKLEEYSRAGYVPMHMPGGKRNTEYASTSELDITEIDGFDNMHNAEGIIKNASDRAARLYGADKTLMLVNGSTAGILSAVCGATRRKGKIIVARNCHVSVYNALIMAQLEPVYVIPEVDESTGIYRGLTLEQIKKCVESNMDAQAVIITSPTYEGIVSEVREIASYLHEMEIPLIVDEAHGAHFKFSEEFPESAVEAGADLVINSIHKTLPALTQTALLHISGNYVDYDKVERFWNIYQTTSPSYILIASIDRCMGIIEEQGDYIFKKYINRLKKLRENIAKLKNIKLLASDDISKIILICDDGKHLYDRLLKEYKVQLEMASFKYAIAMTSVADKQEYYDRFLSALQEIDASWEAKEKQVIEADEDTSGYAINNKPEVCMCPADAIDNMDENGYEDLSVNSPDICGRISVSSVLIYPPGMPVVNVGERITDDVCRIINNAIDAGLEVPGLKEGKVRCLR
ncbi:MAG: aminotransferase class I/II-fold pyridoxal phosphate-dependent enzyme [Eubacteriales bacterium]|nr:aminotransferase class I/II-fold pyridoxal phosphate-dependent enzyme [Eubacteriales bacterium]